MLNSITTASCLTTAAIVMYYLRIRGVIIFDQDFFYWRQELSYV